MTAVLSVSGMSAGYAGENVVLVADIDWIAPIIFWIRERGQDADFVVDWKFQNVPFGLSPLKGFAVDEPFGRQLFLDAVARRVKRLQFGRNRGRLRGTASHPLRQRRLRRTIVGLRLPDDLRLFL